MGGLRQKLESQGLRNIVYMVINHQGAQSQYLHPLLAQKLSANILLYKQEEQQPDVWQTLGGEKDDYFIYDRCGRLTHHISMPYSILSHGHVEKAIKDTYCKRICGECTHESTETPEECKDQADAQPSGDRLSPAGEGTGHGHHHRRHHGHGQHGHHHRNHDGHGHSQNQQDVSQQVYEQDGGVFQRQDHLDVGQVQQVVHMHQMQQDSNGGAVGP